MIPIPETSLAFGVSGWVLGEEFLLLLFQTVSYSVLYPILEGKSNPYCSKFSAKALRRGLSHPASYLDS